MADHTKNALRAMAKALEMVTTSVDPEDPIAVEQLGSAIRYLQFLHERIDLLYDRERFELAHHLAMAEQVEAALPPGRDAATRLQAARERGAEVLGRLGANVPEMRACSAELAAALRAKVQAAASWPAEDRGPVEHAVLAGSEDRIWLERAWYLPLGFDHAPAEVPTLESLLPRTTTAAGA